MLRLNRNNDEIEALLEDLNIERQLTDAEIAKEVGVSVMTIRNWRKYFGFPVPPKFFRHFELNYGEGAVAAFREMLDEGRSFTYIGKHFGFSRQRALQITQEYFDPKGKIDA